MIPLQRPTPTMSGDEEASPALARRQTPPSVTDCAYFKFIFDFWAVVGVNGEEAHPKDGFDKCLASHPRDCRQALCPNVDSCFYFVTDPDCSNVSPDIQTCYPTSDTVIYQNQWTRIICASLIGLYIPYSLNYREQSLCAVCGR